MKLPLTRNAVLNFIAVMVFIFLITGCAVPVKPPVTPKVPAMVRLEKSEYPDFFDDMYFDGLDHCISKSLSYLKQVPAARTFSFAGDEYTAEHMIRSLELFRQFIGTAPSAGRLARFIAANYRVYRSVGRQGNGTVLFTGYYEPLLRGSRTKTGPFRYPVYAVPNDLLRIDLARFSAKFKGETITGRIDGSGFVPYYSREAIDQRDVLAGKARALAWLDDPVDLFFLQIQGSGKIFLNTGQTINVHYHTTNGRPYRSIGKFLIDSGAIPRSEMSMQAIRAYLRDHPETVDSVLNYNPSYVFFKLEKDGPLGYLEVKLTPGRSIATDRRIFPAAALAFIQTQKPLIDAAGRIHAWTDLQRFVLNQDTGGAIRGPGRADLFWGTGPYAELAAGHMQHPGAMYFLVLKPDAG